MRRPSQLLLLLAVLPACANDRLFAPRENLNGVGPTGRPAAVYAMPAPAAGEVRLWSDGAERRGEGAAQQTVIRVGFELENLGQEPLVLEPTAVQLDDLASDPAATLPSPLLLGAPSPVAAAPGTTARADLEYALVGDVAPRDLVGFRLRWSVRAGDAVLQQVTPFQVFYPEPADTHDPWPWWGFGYGFSWHRCR